MAGNNKASNKGSPRRNYGDMSDTELIAIVGEVEPGTNRADLIILAEAADKKR